MMLANAAQASNRGIRYVSRFTAAYLIAFIVGCVTELWRAFPAESPGLPFVFVLLLQIAALTALWAAPVAAVAAGLIVAGRRVASAQRDLSWLLLVPPAGFACITAGQLLYMWGTRAFVRQDLAGAVVPVLQLVAFSAIAGAGYAIHRLIRGRLARLPTRLVLVLALVEMVVLAAVHLGRFSEITRDTMFPVLVQLAFAGLAATAGALLPDRWAVFRRGWPVMMGAAAVTLLLLVAMLFGGRLAPLSYPVATSALQQRGLAAARMVGFTHRIGDADNDGFSTFFGGSDCDDADPSVHPLAKDIPGDGIDQDCFDGDESKDAVARAAAERIARRRPARERVRNTILITVDTLRADAVGFAGATHPSTPALDALAARGVVFSRAYTPAPMTRRAFPALLGGRYPSNIHWLEPTTDAMYTVSAPDDMYLAEAASAAGVVTASVLAFSYAKRGRFDQGFRVQKVHPASKAPRETNANRIVNDGIALLRGWHAAVDQPRFFLWLHFYEAHFPYERHPGIDFGASDQERYLGEVRWIDDQLARLFAELDTLGLADDTAIVFTADHGEEFGEHGGKWHGDLYQEDLHVPLLIYLPGGEPGQTQAARTAPRTIDIPVSLVDIAPTVLDLLGIAIPDEYDGDSLVPWLEPDNEREPPPADRFVFAELLPDVKVPRRIVTIIERDWQLIVDFQLGARELFDLRADPRGLHNALIEAPAEARRLEQKLRRHLSRRVGPLRVSTE